MKKKIKKIIRVILICLAVYLTAEFAMLIFDIYLPIKMTYLGSAKGKRADHNFDVPEHWLCYDYLCCGNGYDCFFTQKEFEFEGRAARCNFHDFDFELEFREGKMYIYSYGVPLKKLEYSRWHITDIGHYYYSRAYFDREEFQEGIYYFYEIDNVGIGHMGLEPLPYL